jgi:hypothetical protein
MTNGPLFTLTAGAALSLYQRVNGDGTVAGATDNDVGTVEDPAQNAGETVTVRSRTNPGPVIMLSAGAINVGDDVHSAAAGEVAPGVPGLGEFGLGQAITAATAQGQPVSVVRGATSFG